MRRDRWVVIAAYALLGSANQLLWLTFTPITTPAAHHYGVTVSDIGWLSEIFPLLYVLLAVPAGLALGPLVPPDSGRRGGPDCARWRAAAGRPELRMGARRTTVDRDCAATRTQRCHRHGQRLPQRRGATGRDRDRLGWNLPGYVGLTGARLGARWRPHPHPARGQLHLRNRYGGGAAGRVGGW